jgi:hypothetical protein
MATNYSIIQTNISGLCLYLCKHSSYQQARHWRSQTPSLIDKIWDQKTAAHWSNLFIYLFIYLASTGAWTESLSTLPVKPYIQPKFIFFKWNLSEHSQANSTDIPYQCLWCPLYIAQHNCATKAKELWKRQMAHWAWNISIWHFTKKLTDSCVKEIFKI